MNKLFTLQAFKFSNTNVFVQKYFLEFENKSPVFEKSIVEIRDRRDFF